MPDYSSDYSSVLVNSLYSVYGEPSGHGFDSLLQSETFSSNSFRHSATLSIFFSNVRLSNFFRLQGSLQVFFDILQQTKVPKRPKGLPFYVFRHYETVQNSQFSFFFSKIEKIRIFFCLQRVPLQFI